MAEQRTVQLQREGGQSVWQGQVEAPLPAVYEKGGEFFTYATSKQTKDGEGNYLRLFIYRRGERVVIE